MFASAVSTFIDPGTYTIFGNQCDNVATQIMQYGNLGYVPRSTPNHSFAEYSRYRKVPAYFINEHKLKICTNIYEYGIELWEDWVDE